MKEGYWAWREGRVTIAVMLLAVGARAQQAGPPGPMPGPTAPARAPVGSFPVAPSEPAPMTAPAASSAPPTMQYGAAPQYAGPPPGYVPPVGPWPRPEPFYPPPPKSEPPPPGSLAVRGPYFGASLGVGGPFGGNTATGPGQGFREGFGFLAAAGYAFIPNFGVNLFLHYNHSSLASDAPTNDLTFGENSGHLLLYGIEARGTVGEGPLIGWASLGISLGTGSLGLSSSQSGGFQTLTFHNDMTISFNPMPVLAFGAEIRLIENLSAGPQFRWYATSAHEACNNAQLFSGDVTDPNAATRKSCTQSLGSMTIPDLVFVGIGVSYRLPL